MGSQSTNRLDDYFAAWQARLWRREWLWGGALLSGVALLVSLLVVWVGMRAGFAAWLMWPARLLLLVAGVAGIGWLLTRGRDRVRHAVAASVERRVPSFAGRALTWLGLRDRRSPLLELLAEDTLQVADHHAPEAALSQRELALPAAGAVLALAALLGLGIAGPGLWSYGVRDLWLGWAFPGLMPTQALLVTPGDGTLRRGANFAISIQPRGFAPATATLYARRGAGDWQAVPLDAAAGKFAFTFFALREPLQYYVASTGVQSPRYHVQLVDVPGIENLKLVYHYPSWTRRADETHQPGGDINALAGTQVQLEVKADAPLGAAEIVQDGASRPLAVSGKTAQGAFDIARDGRYYLATRIGGERVRLTDDYFIKLQPDAPPQVKVLRPGRDYSASSIEEVAASVEASDDFGLESLQLRYAVNGGAWQTLPLQAGGTSARDDALLMLENLRADSTGRALEPGDLISYYAVARDHSQSTQTDMYFIDVRPFDRRFEQGQAAGGGGGGGDGDSDEISQRQRQILVSTWNLLRRKNAAQRSTPGEPAPTDPAQLADNAHLLSQLQKTLAQQARSLIQRSRSRELTTGDDDVARFARLMEGAAAAMDPAAQQLATVDLEAAIQPEQQALQQLLRAEAVYRDVQVTQQQGGGGGGGGGQSGRDLAQLYELEMDLQKNQYETGSTATPGSTRQQADELSQKLKELAARQEQLANEMRRQPQSTPEQRWQQEALQREAEQLRQQLQQGQQSSAQNGASQGGASQSGGTQSAANASANTSGNGSAGSAAASQLENAIRSMSAAGQALNNAETQDANRAARAAKDASEQLANARGQLNEQQQANEQRSLQNLAERAAGIYNSQAASDTQLQQALRSLGGSQPGSDPSSGGLSFSQQRQLAADKRALALRYLQLQSDLANQTQRLKTSAPTTAATLEQAQQELRDAQVDTRIALAAQYIERGRAAYIAPSESMVTDELRNLRDTLQRVAATGPATGVTEQQDARFAQTLAEVQRLRQELQQQVANAQRAAAAGASAQGGAAQAGGARPATVSGAPTGGATSPRGGGVSEGLENAPSVAPAALAGELRNAGRAASAVGPLLAGQGASQQEVEQLRSLAQQLQGARLGERGDALEQELRRNLGLLEQLELRMRRTAAKQPLRAGVTEPGARDDEDAVAEYYRQLSRQ